MSYKIRKLQPDEFDLLIPLMKNCFGIDVDIKYFEWKFLKNPAGPFEGFIAEAEDKTVAAYYGVIPEVYIIDSKPVTIYQSCDTMTHSNHRRKGLFEQTAKRCYKHLEDQNKLFVIGFGGGQSTPGFIKFGWRHIFNIQYVFCPRILCQLSLSRNTSSVTEVGDIKLLAHLFTKSNSDKAIHSSKDIQTVEWRLSNPSHEYKTIATKENGVYSSYLCYYVVENKIILFDFFFGDQRSASKLLAVLRKKVRLENLKGIVAFCQEKGPHSNALRHGGFITNPLRRGPLSERVPFIIYSSVKAIDHASDPKKWNVNSFDHDSL